MSKSAVIGDKELGLMKDGSFLVNIARGGVVSEEALCEALKSGKLAGAAVDVYTKEPYDGPLCDLANVILTPHLGSYAKEGKLKMEVDACQNLVESLKVSVAFVQVSEKRPIRIPSELRIKFEDYLE